MTTINAGLLGPAIRWSMAGLIAGLGSGAVFTGWSFGINDTFMPSRLHRLTVEGIAILILGSLVVQVAGRIVRGQRRTRALLVELLDRPGRGYAEGYADGAAGRPVVAAGRRLTLVDGPDLR